MKKEVLYAKIFTFTILLTQLIDLSTADEKLLIRANNEFASRFYQVLAGSTDDNFIFCPLCLSTGMAMLSVGGNEKTTQQLQAAMGFPANESISEAVLLDGFKLLIHEFKNQFKSTRLMFNGIFLSKNLTIEPAYEKKLKHFFHTSPKFLNSLEDRDAEIEKMIADELEGSADSSEEQSRYYAPNEKSNRQTENQLVVANFLNFKAGWEKRFESSGTSQEPFFVSPNEILQVKMMRQTGHFHIVPIPELEARAIALPYLVCDGSNIFPTLPSLSNSTLRSKPRKKKACKSGVKDSRLQMVAILPNDNSGLPLLESKLTPTTLLEIPKKFEYKSYLDLSVPAFDLSSKQDLLNLTSKIGLESLVDTDQNFIRITKDKLTLNSIFHRVSLTVEEKGSRTKSSHLKGPNPWKNPRLVKLDHPFLAFVHDKKLDVILMVLKVVRPV